MRSAIGFGGRPLAWVQDSLAGWRFPSFALASLVLWKLLLLALLLIPKSNAVLGGFAEDFRIWCFGYDPATGRFQIVWLVTMFLEPVVLGAIILAVWWRPLSRVWRGERRSLWRPLLTAVLVVSVCGLLLIGMAPESGAAGVAVDPTVFPADGLRTHFSAPEISLRDQNGEDVRLSALRGRVVLVTAGYATCGHTCPRILAEAKRVIGGLTEAERAGVNVLWVTVDPDRDNQDLLAMIARHHALEAPTYHLLNGPSGEVNEILDALGVSRKRDEKTGVIDHANLFILVDRRGRVAYRFTLGDLQERWLAEALRLLLHES
ncbi:MAG: SCO family protein [Deltaproteobacteria bacterium]|nr:SCO family protein [Deltaproteobacteria bacterium]